MCEQERTFTSLILNPFQGFPLFFLTLGPCFEFLWSLVWIVFCTCAGYMFAFCYEMPLHVSCPFYWTCSEVYVCFICCWQCIISCVYCEYFLLVYHLYFHFLKGIFWWTVILNIVEFLLFLLFKKYFFTLRSKERVIFSIKFFKVVFGV